MKKCELTVAEAADGIMALSALDDAGIARAVATPPDSWGLSREERISLAAYIGMRRDHLLRSVPNMT